jgi:hypothetical protein
MTCSCKNWLKSYGLFRRSILGEAGNQDLEPVGLTPRIKVAILDTGIDSTHDWIETNWKHPDSTYHRYEDFVTRGAEPADEDGHGTYVAGIILDLAPDIDLYIARVARSRHTIRDDAKVTERVKDVSFRIFMTLKSTS